MENNVVTYCFDIEHRIHGACITSCVFTVYLILIFHKVATDSSIDLKLVHCHGDFVACFIPDKSVDPLALEEPVRKITVSC